MDFISIIGMVSNFFGKIKSWYSEKHRLYIYISDDSIFDDNSTSAGLVVKVVNKGKHNIEIDNLKIQLYHPYDKKIFIYSVREYNKKILLEGESEEEYITQINAKVFLNDMNEYMSMSEKDSNIVYRFCVYDNLKNTFKSRKYKSTLSEFEKILNTNLW